MKRQTTDWGGIFAKCVYDKEFVSKICKEP